MTPMALPFPTAHHQGKRLRTLLWPLLACAAGHAVAAPPRYAVTPLGVLPGMTLCRPSQLNELDEVVGSCMPGVENYFEQRGFVWRQGALATTGLMAKGSYSTATGINASSVVVGDGDSGSFRPQGWVAPASTKPKALGSSNSGNSHTLFIGDAGWVGGYHVKGFTDGPWLGVIWTPDPDRPGKYRQTDLPLLLGSPGSVAEALPNAFNQVGQAVGYANNDLVGQRAVLWRNNARHTVVDLGVLPGDSASQALGLNDLGQAVGYSAGGFSQPVLWAANARHTMKRLPLLPGDNNGWAHAINNQGQILGWSQVSLSGPQIGGPARPVLWQDGVVHELQSLLDPATAADWQLIETTAINQRGQIVGVASLAGVRQGVLLTPVP